MHKFQSQAIFNVNINLFVVACATLLQFRASFQERAIVHNSCAAHANTAVHLHSIQFLKMSDAATRAQSLDCK